MIVNLSVLALTASLSQHLVLALSTSDISADTPISSLLASANLHLAKGETNDALAHYDLAVARDPQNYLTLFRRGATYLSLGKNVQAIADFDKVLTIKPGFEGALLQRAKIKARIGDWKAAEKDFLAHGNSQKDLAELEESRKAVVLAAAAEKRNDWEECVLQSSKAIIVANKMSSLRKTRAYCRLKKGEAQEAVSDLKQVLHLEPGMIEPHLQISAITFYGLSDLENGIEQLRKCLHSDPDSKKCKSLYRREKLLEKQFSQIKKNLERGQYATAIKTLLSTADGEGMVEGVKDDVQNLRKEGTIMENQPSQLIGRVVEMTCQAYFAQKNHKKAGPWCDEALQYNKHSLYGFLSKARQQMQAEQFEAALSTLKEASEHHSDEELIDQMSNEAQVELKRAKNKDYYKVLGIDRDADELQIKSAYRRMVKLHHPDKAHKRGISKEVAEKKVAAVNEAYEVLSDPELKRRYDQGDDPNSHEPQQYGQPFEQGEWFTQGGFPWGGQTGNFKFKYNGQEFRFT